MIIVWILLGLVVLAAIVGVVTYNGLIGLRNKVEEGWRQIDVELKRRHDLIPNLVETVKGYAAHEKETLDAVVQAVGRTLDPHRQSPEPTRNAAVGITARETC